MTNLPLSPAASLPGEEGGARLRSDTQRRRLLAVASLSVGDEAGVIALYFHVASVWIV